MATPNPSPISKTCISDTIETLAKITVRQRTDLSLIHWYAHNSPEKLWFSRALTERQEAFC